jgi:TRAP-type C4-dicarboxylate transport system permease small subunit
MVNYSLVILMVILLLIGGYHFDIEQAWKFYGEKFSPNNPRLGAIIFFGIILLFIFLDDIIRILFRRRKYQVKGKF